ncbi:aminotransferase class I/II-fold pyridoxal phosphate-dependent enzyme [Halobacillus salinarum]|uniref:Aminotransferase class I/II-fold pyridoxal phosphate-dependent enzyme n=1 Tax=Halobacillus salinarum TaxID=2932257 RepID=A0ABY4ER42_9BACI|nr:aminotransferase class I/II-fold pyridoxal phosphate-dependent enzyme [Halobacillus salinarum]UOQ46353.1 aminotransferase class I/II-fold pyridoxal phosphate-dependent enzyme [Halobacillus salinarum]
MSDSSFETQVVHNHIDQSMALNSKTTPIYQTTAFTFKDLDHLESYYNGEAAYLYTRERNPNTEELGQTIARLEKAEAGVATSSGMSAILSGILSVVKPGDHLIAAEDVYGGTYHLLSKELKDFGLEVSLVSFHDLEEVRKEIRPNTRLLYTESISNPFLRVEDIPGIVSLAKEHGLKTMVDNTFATPYLLTPIEQGIDLVVHSATKYIGGHSDVTAGVLVGRSALIQTAAKKVSTLGASLSPFEAWLAQRGTKTLALRMDKQSENAKKLANALKEEPHVKTVYYPEFVSERGNGAIVTIELQPNVQVEQWFKSLGWVKIAPTLAGVETTVSYPVKTSHRSLNEHQLETVGINEYVIRLSVGIEDSEDIIKQFKEAIKQSI